MPKRVGFLYEKMLDKNHIKQTIMKGKLNLHTARSIMSRIGQLRYCNSRLIYQKYIDPIGINQFKHIIRSQAVQSAMTI